MDPIDDEPDLRGPVVIVHGSVIGGFKFLGPFETIDSALQWHEKYALQSLLGLQATIVLLDNPDEHKVIGRDIQ